MRFEISLVPYQEPKSDILLPCQAENRNVVDFDPKAEIDTRTRARKALPSITRDALHHRPHAPLASVFETPMRKQRALQAKYGKGKVLDLSHLFE